MCVGKADASNAGRAGREELGLVRLWRRLVGTKGLQLENTGEWEKYTHQS